MRAFVFTLTALLAAGAWAADISVAVPNAKPGPAAVAAGDRGGWDGIVELQVESASSATNAFAWYTGADSWVGNDFDLTTIGSWYVIHKARFYQWPGWPNGSYEGYRAGIYSFTGGIPGSLLWGPTWMAHTGGAWNEWPNINYWLPGGATQFMMCGEQYYNYPSCDNASIAGQAGGHSWYYFNGWSKLTDLGYGDGLMLRCTVMCTDVTPASLGRVKALYH
jgi:hypothetical protein